MVITSLTSNLGLTDSSFNSLSEIYKALGNPARLRILAALDSRSMSFTELMKALWLNPKIVSSSLSSLGKVGLVRKSYPHRVYVVTPLGRRVMREQILPLGEGLLPMFRDQEAPA